MDLENLSNNLSTKLEGFFDHLNTNKEKILLSQLTSHSMYHPDDNQALYSYFANGNKDGLNIHSNKMHKYRNSSALSKMMLPIFMLEQHYYSEAIDSIVPNDNQIIIAGMHRAGTTLLNELLFQNEGFGSPIMFQTLAPKAFFTMKNNPFLRNFVNQMKPRKRGMDEMEYNLFYPQESLSVCAGITPYSPLHIFTFPRQMRWHLENIMFGKVKNEVREEIKSSIEFVRKQTQLNVGAEKHLLEKDPFYSGCIDLLSAMNENIKIIFPVRNPVTLYNSYLELFKMGTGVNGLQEYTDEEMHEDVLWIVENLFAKAQRDLALIPPENVVYVTYEELKANKVKTIEKIDENIRLNLPGVTYDKIKNLLKERESYKPNKFNQLDPKVESEILERWSGLNEFWRGLTES
jgi:hypothetical protein